ncbi:probable cytochrome b reductase 1 [Coccomyxa sp. Obi]|nr:probable cytochrome b reductase 1 [Coccomyxa sp. Obi]
MGIGRSIAWGAPRVLWLAALIVLLIWVERYGYGFKNAAADYGAMLSLHYLFMFLAFPVCMAEAILSYRVPLIPVGSRSSIKYMHATLHTLAGIFIILGLVFVQLFKRTSKESHFFSLHSWIGITAIAMYVGQYVAGLYIYLVSKWAPQAKADFYKVHRFLGAATLLTGFAAILLGVMVAQEAFLLFQGVETLFSPATYSISSLIMPLLGYLLFLLAVSIMLQFVVFEEQVIAAPSSIKESAI